MNRPVDRLGLAATGLTKRFGRVVAVDDVSFELPPGAVTAIVGENGAGKSTLTSILAGVISPDSGEIRVGGTPVSFTGPADSLAHGVAVVYQELSLIPAMSITDNLFPARQPRHNGLLNRAAGRAAARAALARVGLVDLDPDTPVERLSLARQQLVEIARALANDPQVLIFDEPTSSLSNDDASRLLEIVRQLAADGVAVGYISHRIEELFSISDYFLVLRDGASVWSKPAAEVDTPSLLRAMVGRAVDETYPDLAPPEPTAAPRLVVDSVILLGTEPDGISFEVYPGEVLGIAGLVGAGRSRIARMLAGLERYKSGSITVNGQPYHPRHPRQAISKGVLLVPEDRKRHGVILDLGVDANIVLPSLAEHSKWGVVDRRAAAQTARNGAESTNVKTDSFSSLCRELSGGNQQKVVLAKWLEANPSVLILDEPTRGIDVNARAEIYRLLERLAADGLAIVLISSDLPEVLGLSHRVIVVADGRITGEHHRPFQPDRVIADAAMAPAAQTTTP